MGVTVFERARGDLAGRGAGLGIHDELFAVMRRIGIRADDSIGIEWRSRIALDRSGSIVCEVPLPGITSAWDRIYRKEAENMPTWNPSLYLQFANERTRPVRDLVTAINVSEASAVLRGDLGELAVTFRSDQLYGTRSGFASFHAPTRREQATAR